MEATKKRAADVNLEFLTKISIIILLYLLGSVLVESLDPLFLGTHLHEVSVNFSGQLLSKVVKIELANLVVCLEPALSV